MTMKLKAHECFETKLMVCGFVGSECWIFIVFANGSKLSEIFFHIGLGVFLDFFISIFLSTHRDLKEERERERERERESQMQK